MANDKCDEDVLIFEIEDLSDRVEDAEKPLHEKIRPYSREGYSYGMSWSRASTNAEINNQSLNQSDINSLAEKIEENRQESAALKADIEAFCEEIEKLRRLRDQVLKDKGGDMLRFQEVFEEMRKIRLANEQDQDQRFKEGIGEDHTGFGDDWKLDS